MTPFKEIGECLVSAGETDYFFRPSLLNMTRIGSPAEIVQAFYDLHNDEVTPLVERAIKAYGFVPEWLMQHIRSSDYGKRALLSAMSVLEACTDTDMTPLIGEFLPAKRKGRTFKRRYGAMSDFEMLVLARSLITHGVIGKAKVRQLQKHEGGSASTEFNAFEYISAARSHFGISRNEAEQLTMTEFQMMISAKYPDQKGFTREEYDSVADNYLARKADRLKKSASR